MSESRTISTGIIKRGNTYRFTVSCGMDIHNKQIRKTTTWRAPEDMSDKKADKLAIEKYIEYKNQCLDNKDYNDNMRFSELVSDYMNIYAPNKLKESTMYVYNLTLNEHILEYFGNMKLKNITTSVITKFYYNHEIAKGMIKNVNTVLGSIFSFAVSQHYIKESPCKNIILPNNPNESSESKRMYLDENEILEFLSIFDGYSRLNTIIKLLTYTGMRIGECLGLQWCDIDFDNNIISIKHTLSRAGGKHYLSTPKTKSSKRNIYMSNSVANMLKEHKHEQHKIIFALGGKYEHPEMVFASSSGKYMQHNAVYDSFKRKLKNTKFNHLTLHSLRHCNATLLLNSGADIKIVSDHLGHSNISITANIYADVLSSTKKRTAELIELKLAR